MTKLLAFAALMLGTGMVHAELPRAAFLYVGPVGDAGWTYRHDVARQCLEAAGYQTAYVESVPETPDAANVERDFIAQGYDAIFATAFGYQPFTQQVALEHPEVAFFGITPTVAPGENIHNFYGEVWDARYLTGIVAGSMTKSNRIGFVAAQPIPTVIAGLNAFTMGARSVNPAVEVEVIWTLSWYDPAAEKQAAVTLVQSGADVIAQHQDTPSALQGAAEQGAWAIGSESEMSAFAPDRTLTGTVWNWCEFYQKMLGSVADGTFKPGESYGGLADGVVDITPLNKAVPDDVAALVKERKAGLIDGSFDYWAGPILDNKGATVVAAGATVSIEDINSMMWLVEGVIGTLPNQ